MAVNQNNIFKLEQRSVLKSLMTKKCKLSEIYRKMCDVHGQACFFVKKPNECLQMH